MIFLSFGVCIYMEYFFHVVRNKLQTIKNIYTRVNIISKVQGKNVTRERAINFDQ